MKRSCKGDKTKRSERYAQSRHSRIAKNYLAKYYPEKWAENFTEQVKSEWADKHPEPHVDKSHENTKQKNPNQKK